MEITGGCKLSSVVPIVELREENIKVRKKINNLYAYGYGYWMSMHMGPSSRNRSRGNCSMKKY